MAALIVELAGPVTQADSEVEAAGGDEIEGGGVLSNPDGRVQRQQQQKRPDANPLGPCGDRGADRKQRRRVAVIDEVVLGEPRFVEAQHFGLHDEVEVRTVTRARQRESGFLNGHKSPNRNVIDGYRGALRAFCPPTD